MDTNTDHFTPLTQLVQGQNMKDQNPLPISNGNNVDDLQPYMKCASNPSWNFSVKRSFSPNDNDKNAIEK